MALADIFQGIQGVTNGASSLAAPKPGLFDRILTNLQNVSPEAWQSLASGLAQKGTFAQGLAGGLSGMHQTIEKARKQASLSSALEGAIGNVAPNKQPFIKALAENYPDALVGPLAQSIFKPDQQGPFQGESVPGQALNLVVRGQKDPTFRATPEYEAAWQQLYGKPTLTPGPTGELVPVMIAPPQGFIPPGATSAPPAGAPRTPTVGAPLPGTGTPPNNEQVLSQGFANRMSAADKVLTDPKISTSVADPMNRMGNAILGNYGVSSNFQQGDQAQRDFVNAILRRESGAAISQSEFENAAQQYFPQPGDGKEVLQQKAAARQRAIENMKLGARPGSMAPNAAPAAPPQGDPGQLGPAATPAGGGTPVPLPARGQPLQKGQLYQGAKGPVVYLGTDAQGQNMWQAAQ